MNMSPELWERMFAALNEGLWVSLSLIVPSAFLGFWGGVVIGSARVFAPRPIKKIADAFVALFRGVPLLLQLYFLYYALPGWGISFTAYQAAVIGFVLCSAAYQSEYIRGALLSIRTGQIRAAEALGFSRLQMVTTIMIPQALRRALPGCGNEIIYLIKYSSLAHVVTCMELTGQARQVSMRSFDYFETYITVGIYYLALTTLAAWFLRWLEGRIAVPGFGSKAE